ncbi:uncharacterized protein LOC116201292 [Punica granatum]|uniref:Uncharacterized protein LOC116201292 n=2 Tax=Punica granatum TaxID=22663 RepID=A0A6P8CW90_PUNGR|nr:uncharacterized protein LOC116201292 [Punica granatum]
MESSLKHSRGSQLLQSSSLKQRKSGYEPSDTETESREHDCKGGVLGSQDPQLGAMFMRDTNPGPLKLRPWHSPPKVENGGSPPERMFEATSMRRRHSSKSPYKPRRDDAGNALLPQPSSDFHRNVSPFSKLEHRRHRSPYKLWREERDLDNNNDLDGVGTNRKQSRRTPTKDGRAGISPIQDIGQTSVRSNYLQRSISTPKLRIGHIAQNKNYGQVEQKGGRTSSPLAMNTVRKQREASPMKAPSVGEINEMVANLKLARAPMFGAPNFESNDSIAPGDIFFSRDYTALMMQNDALPKNNGSDTQFNPVSEVDTIRDSNSNRWNNPNGVFELNPQRNSSYSSVPQMGMNYSSTTSRHSSSKRSTTSSKMSNSSTRTTDSMKKFTANRKKSQSEPWFACMRRQSCKTSKTPETKAFDEASFIDKAFVVETLRQFWADKHQPGSLDGFTVHKQEAQLLKQLVSSDVCPHILFQGPSGSGKRALTMAFLQEIYGDQSCNVSHELRNFQIQEKRQMQIAVPLTSSAHHVELNVHKELNARYALMAIVKEINNYHAIAPEVSTADFKADYKVIVLYEVDKAAESIQHLIKWIIDCYSDSCKLILCSEDDGNILESVKSQCKVIKVDAPVAHEIMEVLIQIARKEDFELSMNFAAKIATKSKQNIRKAIMALEACKAHNYPFVEDQPIPFGWEEVLVELASEILADPSPKRLFFIRGKIQKLLMDFVHPKLILQKLIEQFLRGVESSSRRELYYWHAYYEKRLPTGTTALLKLEEFVAKFMSIHRKSSGRRQYV